VASEENAQVLRGVRYRVSVPSESASQRRSLDERLFVRFPFLYRLIADRLMPLPPGSRLRRLMLLRVSTRLYAAVNRRDFEVMLLPFDPGVEYHVGDVVAPDMDVVFHGHDGYREVWRQLIDSFDDYHAESAEVLDLGDQLLATTQYRGHGSGSGVPVNETRFQLFRLRRGLVAWQRDFSDRSKALEAAALRE
jgi:ketosteroid isomerase-like protein